MPAMASSSVLGNVLDAFGDDDSELGEQAADLVRLRGARFHETLASAV